MQTVVVFFFVVGFFNKEMHHRLAFFSKQLQLCVKLCEPGNRFLLDILGCSNQVDQKKTVQFTMENGFIGPPDPPDWSEMQPPGKIPLENRLQIRAETSILTSEQCFIIAFITSRLKNVSHLRQPSDQASLEICSPISSKLLYCHICVANSLAE